MKEMVHLLRNIDGKLVEVSPDNSVKKEVLQKMSDTAAPQTEAPQFVQEENLPKLTTATTFHKSGKEKMQVKNSNWNASDRGGPSVLEPKRRLSKTETINRDVQRNKSEGARGRSRSSIDVKQRSRGKTPHKVSWKLNRLHQRRGLEQSKWDRS